MQSTLNLAVASMLLFSCLMLENGQTYFKNLAVFTQQNCWSMFGHFSVLYTKCLNDGIVSDVQKISASEMGGS